MQNPFQQLFLTVCDRQLLFFLGVSVPSKRTFFPLHLRKYLLKHGALSSVMSQRALRRLECCVLSSRFCRKIQFKGGSERKNCFRETRPTIVRCQRVSARRASHATKSSLQTNSTAFCLKCSSTVCQAAVSWTRLQASGLVSFLLPSPRWMFIEICRRAGRTKGGEQ